MLIYHASSDHVLGTLAVLISISLKPCPAGPEPCPAQQQCSLGVWPPCLWYSKGRIADAAGCHKQLRAAWRRQGVRGQNSQIGLNHRCSSNLKWTQLLTTVNKAIRQCQYLKTTPSLALKCCPKLPVKRQSICTFYLIWKPPPTAENTVLKIPHPTETWCK